ncbi:MAG: hypothetical protein WBC93_13805 [Sulfitobacter sp.]
MATKNPFDPSEFFKAFDPDAIKKMFDPQNMFAVVPDMAGKNFDFQSIVGANGTDLKAVTEANMSAVKTYNDLLNEQMAIFEKLTTAARGHVEQLEPVGGADAATRNAKIVNDAVSQAFQLMQEMAEAATKANTKVFEETSAKVEEAIANIKKV